MSRFLFFMVLIFISNQVMACSCEPSQNELDYDFIALVLICGNETAYDHSSNELHKGNYQSNFEILEHYKGPRLTHTIVNSFHPDIVGGISSCDLYLNPGQEVLVYSKYSVYHQDFITGYCFPTTRYKDAKGLRNWHLVERLERLGKKYLGIDSVEVIADTLIGYFPNQQIEFLEPYQNGQLHGERRRYFPDGILQELKNYKDGQLHGLHQKYTWKGRLTYTGQYADGKKEGLFQYKFNPKGQPRTSIIYQNDKMLEEWRNSKWGHTITYYDYQSCIRTRKEYENGVFIKATEREIR